MHIAFITSPVVQPRTPVVPNTMSSVCTVEGRVEGTVVEFAVDIIFCSKIVSAKFKRLLVLQSKSLELI